VCVCERDARNIESASDSERASKRASEREREREREKERKGGREGERARHVALGAKTPRRVNW